MRGEGYESRFRHNHILVDDNSQTARISTTFSEYGMRCVHRRGRYHGAIYSIFSCKIGSTSHRSGRRGCLRRRTQRTTAHLTDVVDDRYANIEKMYGVEKARLVYESHRKALDLIERNISDESMSCDFTRLDGFLFTGQNQSNKILDKELAVLRRIGYEGVEMLEELPLQGVPVKPCLSFHHQAQFHPLKYVNGLLLGIQKRGGGIFTHTRVKAIRDGAIVSVETNNGLTVNAGRVVLTTNSPIGGTLEIHTKQAAYRTYVIGASVPAHSIPLGLYWDTEDPYHYVRLQRLDNNDEYEVLLVGGEDHRTGIEPEHDCFERLESWAREWFIGFQEIMFKWSGQIYEPVDALAFIGRDPAHGENVFLASGNSGTGMTYGTMSGFILHDLILGRPNSFSELYDPARKTIEETAEFIKENVSGLVRYFDYATPGDVKSTDEIQPGHGAVIRKGLEKIACYKDEQGLCHEMSAVCPHMKGIVHWNEQEKTWDCPIHGSRFNATGSVINGPANTDLEPADSKVRTVEDTFDATPDPADTPAACNMCGNQQQTPLPHRGLPISGSSSSTSSETQNKQ